MKKGIIIFGVLAAFILITVTAQPALAQRYWRQGVRQADSMNLTEEQIEQIQDLRLDFQKSILPLRTQMQTLYLELRGLYRKDSEQAQIDAKIAEIDKMELELEEKYKVHQDQIRELLTDEQKAVFDRWGGLGLGLGPGMGYGRGYGMDYGRGYGRGAGRGWSRGSRQDWDRGMGRGWRRDPRMGRGYRCPWFRNWRW